MFDFKSLLPAYLGVPTRSLSNQTDYQLVRQNMIRRACAQVDSKIKYIFLWFEHILLNIYQRDCNWAQILKLTSPSPFVS